MSIPTNNLTTGNGKRWLIPIILIVLVIASVIGFFVYKHHVKHKKADAEATLPAVKIYLKNGCGFDGAATEMTEFLTDKNIDIVATGNAEKFIYNKTIIVVKKMDRDDLIRLMKMTGIREWTLAESDYPLAPFVIVIGKDYEQLINSQKEK